MVSDEIRDVLGSREGARRLDTQFIGCLGELWDRQGQAGWRHPLGCSLVTRNDAILVFAFLLWHNQPNIGNLELSLKPKSFSGRLSKGGLSKKNELITATTCYLLHRTLLVMGFSCSAWARECFYSKHYNMACEQKKREMFWDLLVLPSLP